MLVEKNVRTILCSELPLELFILRDVELCHFCIIKECPAIIVYFWIVQVVTCINTDSFVNNKSLKFIILYFPWNRVISQYFFDLFLCCLEPINMENQNLRFVNHGWYLNWGFFWTAFFTLIIFVKCFFLFYIEVLLSSISIDILILIVFYLSLHFALTTSNANCILCFKDRTKELWTFWQLAQLKFEKLK